MEGDKEISEMMAQMCVITDEVERQDNVEIGEISDSSEKKEDDPPVENAGSLSEKMEESQVKKPGKEKQEEILATEEVATIVEKQDNIEIGDISDTSEKKESDPPVDNGDDISEKMEELRVKKPSKEKQEEILATEEVATIVEKQDNIEIGDISDTSEKKESDPPVDNGDDISEKMEELRVKKPSKEKQEEILATEEVATIVEKQDNIEIGDISDTSEKKESDPPVDNGDDISEKMEELQVKKPSKEKQEEILATEEVGTIVEKQDNIEIGDISDTSDKTEGDASVENGDAFSEKMEESQVKEPGKEMQEEVLTTVPNYLDVVKNLDYPRLSSTQFFERIQAEPLQDIYNNIEELVGDLFAVDPSWAFAHCVSEDMAMFKGIALEFRRRYNKVRFIRNQRAPIGHVAVLHHVPKDVTNNNDRFVFYMVTKQMFSHKPTYYHIYCALVRLRIMCEALNVTKLAMPRIASGCDMKDFRKLEPKWKKE